MRQELKFTDAVLINFAAWMALGFVGSFVVAVLV
jgi:hypothetical protein